MALVGKEKSRESQAHGCEAGRWLGPPGAVMKQPQLTVGVGIKNGFPCLMCIYLYFLGFPQ